MGQEQKESITVSKPRLIVPTNFEMVMVGRDIAIERE